MSLGERLRRLRLERDKQQAEIAKIIGVAPNTISSYERDLRQPDLETLTKLADYFNVSIDYLLGRVEHRNTVIVAGDDVPEELRNIGVEYLEIAKDLELNKIPPKAMKELIEILKRNAPK